MNSIRPWLHVLDEVYDGSAVEVEPQRSVPPALALCNEEAVNLISGRSHESASSLTTANLTDYLSEGPSRLGRQWLERHPDFAVIERHPRIQLHYPPLRESPGHDIRLYHHHS